MKSVMVVFGTRPEAIKMAPVVKALAGSRKLACRLCVTGQHRDMVDQALRAFDLTPHYDLNLMSPRQDLTDVTSRVLIGMRKVLAEERPSLVLVHGDTTTALAAAMAAYYQQIPVGHVEAGLRTNDIYSPWPEEINRQVAGRIARLHFAPTARARENLLAENVEESRIFVTGNTIVDALRWVCERLNGDPNGMGPGIASLCRELSLNGDQRRIILVTGHRRESWGEGLENVCSALAAIAESHPDVSIVYPVHLNPRVREPVTAKLHAISNIHLLSPIDYLSFVFLMSRCYFIVTDSGGIQEEAPSLGKPVLVTRATTERPEAVEAGAVRLVGTDRDRIVHEATLLLDHHDLYERMSNAQSPFGDGHAAERIRSILESTLDDTRRSSSFR